MIITDFDDLDIESNIECQSKKKCKNELVLSRRRSVILTNIELLNVFVIPDHILVADFKLVIAVFTNAVDATFVELSDDAFVKTVRL